MKQTPKFKIGDRIIATLNHNRYYYGAGYYGLLTGIITDISAANYRIRVESFLGEYEEEFVSDYRIAQIDEYYVHYDSPEGAFYRL